MNNTALAALPAPQRVICGAACGSRKRACRDGESLRATMPAPWTQGDGA